VARLRSVILVLALCGAATLTWAQPADPAKHQPRNLKTGSDDTVTGAKQRPPASIRSVQPLQAPPSMRGKSGRPSTRAKGGPQPEPPKPKGGPRSEPQKLKGGPQPEPPSIKHKERQIGR
jgi:hypothetical protein